MTLKDDMTIRYIYEQSILNKSYWLQILIEFLVFEKKVMTLEDYGNELDLYFKQNNEKRINELLIKYANKKENDKDEFK